MFAVLISDTVPTDVADFVVSNRPPKHYAAAESTVLVDAQVWKLLYYEGSVAWGAVYQAGFKLMANQIVS